MAVQEAVLPSGTAAVAGLLAAWPRMEQFYLAGGTALALRLGHRQSHDLDFFTRDPQSRGPELPDLDRMLARFRSVEWELTTKEQLQWRLDGVSVTLWAYPFPHRFALHRWRGLRVADARDIAVQKAYAVYGEAFSPHLFVHQLTYTADLPDRDMAVTLLSSPITFDKVAATCPNMCAGGPRAISSKFDPDRKVRAYEAASNRPAPFLPLPCGPLGFRPPCRDHHLHRPGGRQSRRLGMAFCRLRVERTGKMDCRAGASQLAATAHGILSDLDPRWPIRPDVALGRSASPRPARRPT